MSDASQLAKLQWVERVLGVRVAPPTGSADGFASQWQQGFRDLQVALDTVDQQIATLAVKLRSSYDPWLESIANVGLPAVVADRGPLIDACLEVYDAEPAKIAAAAIKAHSAIDTFAKQIKADRRVKACDENPWGVKVSIVAALGPPLDALKALQPA